MSPVIGLIIVVTLLLGPTVLWLIYLGTRSTPERPTFAGFDDAGQSSGHDEVAALTDEEGFWVCHSCRSINRRDASRCYNCRAPITGPGPGQPGRQAGAPTIWSGDPGATGSAFVQAPGVAVGAAQGGAAQGAAARSRADMERRPDGFAHPTAGAGGSQTPAGTPAATRKREQPSSALWAPSPPPPARSTPRSAAGVVGASDRPRPGVRAQASPMACPYLATRDDIATRFDFPYSGNTCHAGLGAQNGVGLGGQLRQAVLRKSRQEPLAIAVEHQARLCLTPSHGQCPRYLEALQMQPSGAAPFGASEPALPPAAQAVSTSLAEPRPTEAPAAIPSPLAAQPAQPTAPSGGISPSAAPSRGVPPEARRRGGNSSREFTTLTFPPRPAAAPRREAAPPDAAEPPARQAARQGAEASPADGE
jgi:hypothetical protein